MPNKKSARKKLKVDIRRTHINSIRRGRLKKAIKNFEETFKKDLENAKNLISNVIKQIDLSVKNRILNKNKGNRMKSKIMKKVK